MRISGFFRDAFPHVVTMLDDAVTLVAGLEESPGDNFVRAHVDADLAERFDGVLGSASDPDDLEPAVALDHPAQHGARDDRIVDDHQSRAAAMGRDGSGIMAGPRQGGNAAHRRGFKPLRRVEA